MNPFTIIIGSTLVGLGLGLASLVLMGGTASPSLVAAYTFLSLVGSTAGFVFAQRNS